MTENQITICGHGSGFPTTKNMYTYLENRYNLFADNGKRKGLVAVRRVKNFTDNERLRFHDAYKSILGRNYYSQDLREYVFTPYKGRYYSDCSSSGDACYAKSGHDVGWLNTAGMYTSSKFETVPVVIKNGHVQNPDILKVGDALLFVGNDPSRPKQIGHVEYIYELPSDTWHWVHVGSDWYYQDGYGNNSYGWKVIPETGGTKSHWYYFDSVGKMLTGHQWINGKYCLFMDSGSLEGAMCKSDDDGYQYIWDV